MMANVDLSIEDKFLDRYSISHVDILQTSTGIVDNGLIRDEANEAVPNRGPRVEV